ncbi:hypothetical protein [Streptomyces sp. MNP-20]|uniref:hypothetical protein n=1 Tax=Streptomyces sp. MNP-20 TaxID=2721165 RepID=UPI00155362A1|nr:hypothetical protein [Streptomyces sp. MNP-20]
MTFGFAPSAAASASDSLAAAATTDAGRQPTRMLEPSEWSAAEIPLLRNPREVVSGLHARHRPTPATAIVAVLDPEERVRASASFARRASAVDGWVFRNALLAQLRRVIPHDLRRRTPVRTAVLLYCRDGDGRWTQEDGAWMWGLRDACTLHGLRCGAYITLTREGWQVLGEGRGGRRPSAGSPPEDLAGTAHAPGAGTAAGDPRQLRTGGAASEMLRRVAAR